MKIELKITKDDSTDVCLKIESDLLTEEAIIEHAEGLFLYDDENIRKMRHWFVTGAFWAKEVITANIFKM
jgi:hypothetical protein